MNISGEARKAIIGGSLLSISSSLNLILKGRITGISGIVYGLVTLTEYLWRFYFVLGLIYSALFSYLFIDKNMFDDLSTFTGDLSLFGFLLSGFLIGSGAKLANGCTSGHGVCGLPRFSLRSIAACVTFFTFGVISATLRQYFPFFGKGHVLYLNEILNSNLSLYILFTILNILVCVIFIKICYSNTVRDIIDFVVSFSTGILFGLGLIISGMVKKSKVINFLNFASDKWDPSLLYVFLTAVGLNMIFFTLILKYRKIPILSDKMNVPQKTDINWQLLGGSMIFGIGWGISGLCPGPQSLNLFLYPPHSLLFFIGMITGQYTAERVNTLYQKYKQA